MGREMGREMGRRRLFQSGRHAFKTRAALVPPNPKLLLMAVSMGARRALWGT
jgi:hypothetical protein